jgi:ferric-dicitrate binding protein FerR (iron transport regulator)
MARSNKAKATKAAGGAAAAAAAARNNQYVQRIITDAELRDNARVAYDSARRAFDRLQSGKKGPAQALASDKKLQKELRNAAEALRETATALREGPKKKKRRGGFGRKLLVLVVGAGVALALSEGLRNKVLDALFGAEEEFEYTSTTAPATPAPAGSTT